MDKVFGEYLIRCKVLDVEQQKKDDQAQDDEEVKGDDNQDLNEVKDAAQDKPYCYEKVTVEDALVRTTAPYVAVLFTAEYCPPCEAFNQPFKDFIAEANRVAGNPKFQILVVNCDK